MKHGSNALKTLKNAFKTVFKIAIFRGHHGFWT